MWDGFDKRKFPRLNLRCELVLSNPSPTSQVLRTQTENVGAGGICVILEKSLERFSVLSVRLELDPHLPWIECAGKVVWSVPSRDRASKKENFDTGIEFLNLEPAQQDLIRHYVGSRLETEERLQ
jgi:c-di-GMP-binding flagellar brake protein YcgR